MIQIGVRVTMQQRSRTYGTGANMALLPVLPGALTLLVGAVDDTRVVVWRLTLSSFEREIRR